MDTFLMKLMRRGNGTRIGLFERIYMGVIGKRDGKKGFPREDEHRVWTSPAVQTELNRCLESQNRIFGTVMVTFEDQYVEASKLMQIIEHNKCMIQTRISERPAPLTEEETYYRKMGEESLMDEQIKKRRLREHEKRCSKSQAEINRLRSETEEAMEKLVGIRSFLAHKEEEAAAACERIRNHASGRIELYWSAAGAIAFRQDRYIPPCHDTLTIPDVLDGQKFSFREKAEQIDKVVSGYNDFCKEVA